MSNEQKPSAEDREIARQFDPDCPWDSCLICEARAIRVSKILARVRREARAEAFEDGAKAMRASQYVEEAKVLAPLFDMLAKQARQERAS